MRARLGLAQTLEELDRNDEAIAHYRERLRLDAGDNQGVRYALLRTAQRTNRHVPRYITGDDERPGPEPTAYAPGSREEAVICDIELGDAWRATPDAIRWLRGQAPSRRSGKRRKR
jgi:hypothetical protein